MENPVNFVGMTEDTSSRIGNTVPFTSTAIPNSFGEFTVDVRLPSVLFPEGDYVVKANYGGLKASEYFQLFLKEILSLKTSIGSGNPNTSIPGKTFF